MRTLLLEDVVVDHVVVAERKVDDPTLIWHQWVDVVDASVVGQVVANAILDALCLVVVAAILALAGVSIFVVYAFVVILLVVVVVVVVDVVDPFSLVNVVEAMVVVSLDATQVLEVVLLLRFALLSASARGKYSRMISSTFSRILMLILPIVLLSILLMLLFSMLSVHCVRST